MAAFPLRLVEDELQPLPSKGWAEMIRKVYEVDPLLCRQCGGQMKVIAFLTDYTVIDRIINHLKLSFVAERPPPHRLPYQEVLMDAENSSEVSMNKSKQIGGLVGPTIVAMILSEFPLVQPHLYDM